MSSTSKKIFEVDKTDPIKWAQPRKQTAVVLYKPPVHPREADLARFRDVPSLVTGRRA